jgi:hypothetical protein
MAQCVIQTQGHFMVSIVLSPLVQTELFTSAQTGTSRESLFVFPCLQILQSLPYVVLEVPLGLTFFLGPIIMSHPCSLQPRPSRISTLRGHFCHNHWNTSWSDDSDPRGFFRLVPGVGGASKIIAAVDAADQFRY